MDDDIKAQIEQTTPLCTYYKLLDAQKGDNYVQQLKRIKIIIHDMVDRKLGKNIEKRITSEATYEPLKSLLKPKKEPVQEQPRIPEAGLKINLSKLKINNKNNNNNNTFYTPNSSPRKSPKSHGGRKTRKRKTHQRR